MWTIHFGECGRACVALGSVVSGTDARALYETLTGDAWRPSGRTWVEGLSGTRPDVACYCRNPSTLLGEVVLVILGCDVARVGNDWYGHGMGPL